MCVCVDGTGSSGGIERAPTRGSISSLSAPLGSYNPETSSISSATSENHTDFRPRSSKFLDPVLYPVCTISVIATLLCTWPASS